MGKVVHRVESTLAAKWHALAAHRSLFSLLVPFLLFLGILLFLVSFFRYN
jgi:hypothetical protein